MNVSLIPGRDLSPDLVVRWRAIQDSSPEFASPYFCPEFTQAVAAVRHDVFIGVLEESGGVVGLFPFQRARLGVGKPVGGPLSDYHAVVCLHGVQWNARELLAGCRLNVFQFDHMLASQTPFLPFHTRCTVSHRVSLEGGFEVYTQHLRAQKSEVLRKVAQSVRRIERELSPVHFEPTVQDLCVLRSLVAWKSAQYRRTRLIDVFSFPWTVALLEHVLAARAEMFAGVLSALYVGDRLVAAHLGMRSRSVLHWWFPAHDVALQQYSPGMVLLIEALKYAARDGIRLLDLGKGDSLYKDRLKGHTVAIAEGCVERPSVAAALRRIRHDTEAWIRQGHLLPLARIPGRLLARAERWSHFR